MCQKYGDLKPNVSKPFKSSVEIVDTNVNHYCSSVNTVHILLLSYKFIHFLYGVFPQEAGRLLYLGQNEWAHVNCCLWSAEVFEEDNGSLLHVHSAVTRGRLMVGLKSTL